MPRFLMLALLISVTSTTLAGCAASGLYQTGGRSLPSAETLVPDPAPKPRLVRGASIRAFAGALEVWGEDNAARLVDARANVDGVVRDYAAGATRADRAAAR